MKTEWALICVHDGKFRTDRYLKPLNLITKGELLVFKTKKEAEDYVHSNFKWALMPIKVYAQPSKWDGKDNYYHINKD